MDMLQLQLENALKFIDNNTFSQMLEQANKANLALEQKNGPGKEFLGWLDLPSSTDKELIDQIKQVTQQVKSLAQTLVVIGIGGSYLGAKAAIEALKDHFNFNNVIFAGFNLNEKYLYQLENYLINQEFALCVISKSGTTLEPSVTFHRLRKLAEKKYGKNAYKRIIAITNPHKGILLDLAKTQNYHLFFIPDNVGGRYSVLTPVGLVPIAFAGFDIQNIIDGARIMQVHSSSANKANLPERYAAIRNILYKKGYLIELLTTYSMELEYFGKWWQQLFGESEGKDNKGIFPANALFTTDLHSLGQFIQQGTKKLFETVIFNKHKPNLIKISPDKDNIDQLNYLQGKSIEEINEKAFLGTLKAHTDGNVPNIVIKIPTIDEFILGQMFYFFERACGISGYILGVNPFNQPGVEAYKKNMFHLLNRPGF